ncbi:uncharacterized protein At1g65710-like [Macadamia integrifolia]|uniref:uncharacterized protein At1g65710-like n=1 Tax=Macadamia integrifolia TaxID=60698 RepID=UPI001C4FB6FE|nr:uncharacterized protein At1g65710-like [Macadamia integrifolia]XP_042504561.1 uncharacterized protein At1g65710-like [Macadamia integrifolia]
MGSCLSKKGSSPSTDSTRTMSGCLNKKGSSPSSAIDNADAPPSVPTCKAEKEDRREQKKAVQVQEIVKKEVFLIKQRKSHERRPEEKGAEAGNTVKDEFNSNGSHVNETNVGSTATMRTSSCTKEEVDAILIQCGRLSRSSSGKVPGTSENSNNNNSRGLGSSGSRKYSGSKRSYDFDHDDSNKKKGSNVDADDEAEEDEEEKQQLYQRQSRPSRSHRRTPSREKDVDYKRSSSRDHVSPSAEERRRSSGSGRRVSRSPGRSENPTAVTGPASNPGPDKSRPGRMVSVPASVSKEKSTSIPDPGTGIKRVSGKRSGENGGGLRTASSPRSQSPANTRAPNENGQQVPSLSRNSSKKAEHSPYRRNPMSDIDENILRNEQVSLSKATFNKLQRNREGSEEGLTKKLSQLQSVKPDERKNGVFTEHPPGTKGANDNNIRGLRENNGMGCKAKEQQRVVEEREVAVTVAATGADDLKPQTITRSRSSRRSRDLDLNLDTLLNPTSYASMLLEDIQNFHQQNMTGFSLPPCVTKACSILEAVADLNSCTSSNLSSVFSDDRISEADRSQKNVTCNSHFEKRMESKGPFLESEVGLINDLMEPSLHKYVTVRRGAMGGEMEQQESSGSNSFLNQHWASSSWDPNSADSAERWSSQSNNGDEVVEKEQQRRSSPSGCQKQAFSEPTREIQMGGRRSKQCGNEGTPLPTVMQNGRKRQTTPIAVAAASS